MASKAGDEWDVIFVVILMVCIPYVAIPVLALNWLCVRIGKLIHVS